MMKSLRLSALFVTSVAIALTGCQKSPEPKAAAPAAAVAAIPDTISFTKAALYPEGVDYDAANKRFLVTSLHEGVISEVKADGSTKVVFQDPAMVSAIGIRIDAARDRVLVCNSDPGASIHTKKENQGKLAGLAAFQLSTGKLIKYVDLGALAAGGHFCNDIALDSAGNVYATDSFSPIIYKIDPNYTATIFVQNERFKGEGFNLNGIVVKDDYLIVAKYNEGVLFKFPLNEPGKFSEVKIDQKLVGADGLLWAADGALIAICNLQTNKVFKLTSTDNWVSAKVVGSVDTGNVFATTGVNINGNIHVLYAMLHVLFNPETKVHTETFTINKLKL